MILKCKNCGAYYSSESGCKNCNCSTKVPTEADGLTYKKVAESSKGTGTDKSKLKTVIASTGGLIAVIIAIVYFQTKKNREGLPYILEKAKLAFYYIPDHDKVRDDAKPIMTADLYESLSAAWDVPDWSDCLNNEFLFYFITGNEPSDRQKVKSVEFVSCLNGVYEVNVKYLEVWCHYTHHKSLSSITLFLVNDNGNILLDDFGEGGIKKYCKQYIEEEVENYLSGKTEKYMKEHQSEGWYNDRDIANLHKSFSEYISKYQAYLSGLSDNLNDSEKR